MNKINRKKNRNNPKNNAQSNLSPPTIPESEKQPESKTNPPTEHKQTPNNDINPATKGIKLTDWLMGLGTVVISITTIFYTFYAGKQWKVMNDQFFEMRKSREQTDQAARLDQRAWVGVDFVAGKAEIGKPLIVIVHFKNTGKTPAKNVTAATIVEGYSPNVAPNFKNEKDVTKESSGMIMPQGTMQVNINHTKGRSLDDFGFKAIQEKKIIIYVHGILEYDDIFNRHHWTTFCGLLKSDGSGYTSYNEHNDTDKDQ